MSRREQAICVRAVLTACTSAWLCLSVAAQQVPVPAEPEAPSGVGQSVETSPEAAGDAGLELQRLPASVTARPAPRAAESGEAFPGIGNNDVVEMVAAQFGEATIVAAIDANPTRFDVSPKALLSLKSDGVPERVIEAMLAAESARKQTASVDLSAVPQQAVPAVEPTETPAEVSPPHPAQMSPEALAVLSQVIEQLAMQSAATTPEPANDDVEISTADSHAGQVPRAWIADGDTLVALGPTVAQVAFTDLKRTGATPFKTLQGFTEKALAFANPALGFASGLGGLFRSDDPAVTAVWALLGPSAARALEPGTVFEIEFSNIPGVNPDEYRPAIVQLVPTRDNYRLVGAAKTTEGSLGGAPSGPIIEEPIAAELTPLARGRYRVAMTTYVQPGEYALVLRPIFKRERERRRNSQGSLGELMGGGSSHILYLTWDFSVRS